MGIGGDYTDRVVDALPGRNGGRDDDNFRSSTRMKGVGPSSSSARSTPGLLGNDDDDDGCLIRRHDSDSCCLSTFIIIQQFLNGTIVRPIDNIEYMTYLALI